MLYVLSHVVTYSCIIYTPYSPAWGVLTITYSLLYIYTNYNFIMGVVAVPDLRAMLGGSNVRYGKHFCITVCRSGCYTVSVVRNREAVASRRLVLH